MKVNFGESQAISNKILFSVTFIMAPPAHFDKLSGGPGYPLLTPSSLPLLSLAQNVNKPLFFITF
jgi:hypothetical protein